MAHGIFNALNVLERLKTRYIRTVLTALREWKEQMMNDSISRKGVSTWLYNMGYEKLSEYVLDEKRFPSVDRQQGKWNPYFTEKEYNDTFNCNLCGDTFIVMQGKEEMNFCPNCGARMRDRKIKGNE